MPTFTTQQIKQMLDIIDKNTLIYIGGNIGVDVFSEDDKQTLKRFGVDWKKLKTEFTPYEQMFYFGRLSQILGDEKTRSLTYTDLLKYLKKGQYVPLNQVEKDMLKLGKQRTYGHITGLGEKQKQTVNGIIIENSKKKRKAYEKIIKQEVVSGIKTRSGIKDIVSEIGHRTDDWQRDLGKIVDTEYNNILQEARALQIAKENDGEDSKVYKNVFPGACRHCIRLYLTNGIGSKPKTFTLKELEANGSNIERKVSDWLATIFSVHPFCRCFLYPVPKGKVWDEEKKDWVYPEKLKPKVEIKSKDKIKVGDKIFEV
jgi:hypothetical protein